MIAYQYLDYLSYYKQSIISCLHSKFCLNSRSIAILEKSQTSSKLRSLSLNAGASRQPRNTYTQWQILYSTRNQANWINTLGLNPTKNYRFLTLVEHAFKLRIRPAFTNNNSFRSSIKYFEGFNYGSLPDSLGLKWIESCFKRFNCSQTHL